MNGISALIRVTPESALALFISLPCETSMRNQWSATRE